MTGLWINKIREKINRDGIVKFKDSLLKVLHADKIPLDYRCHLINLFILVLSYIVGSFLIYPEITLAIFIKELFSLICIYGAIFCWFTEKFSDTNIMKVCLAVTTCFTPVIFMNSSFGVAVVTIFVVIFCEYIIFSYMQGHKLFCRLIPSYLICESEEDIEIAEKFFKNHKILELILLAENNLRNMRVSKIYTLDALKSRLKTLECIPFFPCPQRFIYVAKKKNSETLNRLMDLASEYSVSLFQSTDGELSPITLCDLSDVSTVTEKNPLASLFKNKNIWIEFDGRKTVLDLICTLSGIPLVNLTIICESASLMPEINEKLVQVNSFKNYRIKVVDLNFLGMIESRPDILFYNMPIKTRFSDEDHLKEALVKNVIDTDKLIKLAQELKIPMTFVLSSTNSVNANNWTGATQRLGELLCQHADFQWRKTSAKFRVIRIPENISDRYGFLGEVISSILYTGSIRINSSESDMTNLYNSEDILVLFLKAIMFAFKSEKTAEVLTVQPKEKANIENFIGKICRMFALKPDRDIKINYSNVNELMELDNFPNISETLEKTSILNIFATKFVTSSVGNYGDLWTLEQISKMNPREIISAVFQSISEKVNPKP